MGEVRLQIWYRLVVASASPWVTNHLMLIDTEEYTRAFMIYYARKKCPELCDLCKFWEISDMINISLTVQDRDIVAMED